jgi:hypothetical protein
MYQFSSVHPPEVMMNELAQRLSDGERALEFTFTRSTGTPGSVAERWASFVLDVVQAERDPKTIGTWARLLGVSRSVLCECCRLVHVSPRDARDFARVMRAIHRSGERWQPETVLDLADARTLKKLLTRAGFLSGVVLTPSPQEYLDRQQWIPRDNAGLRALQLRLQRPQ